MDSPEKKYYKIREVSELLGVPASTLRFWESEFPSLRPKRNAKGTRFYSQSDMERLHMAVLYGADAVYLRASYRGCKARDTQ